MSGNFQDDPLVFGSAAATVCAALGVDAVRVARDCVACGLAFEGDTFPPGVGSTRVRPGIAIAFVLCETCAAHQDDRLRSVVQAQLKSEYDQMRSASHAAVRA